MSTGPTTVDTSTVALGLAQVRIGASAANVASTGAVLVDGDSIGALANTKFMGEREFWSLESGFPLIEDSIIALREKAALECSFKELTPANLALAHGEDPANYALTHSGEIGLGVLNSPTYIRMEAIYTFPTTTYEMHMVFPRAQVRSSIEMDMQAEDNVNVPVVIEAKRADSSTSGGHANWDSKPLGSIQFIDNS